MSTENVNIVRFEEGASVLVRPGHEPAAFDFEEQPLPENAVVHVILGMWMDDWGMELSETLHVRSGDCRRLCDFPQHVHIVER